jgi:membrane protein required for colicin V production
MVIDVIYIILIVLAVWNGFRKGLIVAVFSLLALIVGLAAALKLSVVTASYIDKAVKVSDEWLPVISFVVVFIIVYLLVLWGAKMLEKTVQVAMLGWVNRLGGAVFFVALYTIIWSVLLFYAGQTQMISEETQKKSVTYSFIQPWGPKTINSLGTIIPIFRNMFAELEDFFSNLSKEIPTPR